MTSPDEIIQAVASVFGVTGDDILGPSRKRFESEPRKVAAFLIRKHLDMPVEDITHFLRRKNHTTCLYWLKYVGSRMESDSGYRSTIEAVEIALEIGLGRNPLNEPLPKDLQDAKTILQARARYPGSWNRLQGAMRQVSECPEQGDGEGS